MSAKLHSGWICDVQFLSSAGPGAAAGGGSTLLLSASNDAIVALWDVSKAAGGKPLKLLESREVHQGSGGPRQCVLRQRVPIIAPPGYHCRILHGHILNGTPTACDAAGGIFSMHAMGTSILTASKDSSVAVSDLSTEVRRERHRMKHSTTVCSSRASTPDSPRCLCCCRSTGLQAQRHPALRVSPWRGEVHLLARRTRVRKRRQRPVGCPCLPDPDPH